ncbi:unnamed protein product [Pipistrellus nathusii]|uniref:Uncharacterized protein n=1 Tax=Pipistrellus nathusii TaxID=59473 RepID=A0ABP0A0M6_PIPNA
MGGHPSAREQRGSPPLWGLSLLSVRLVGPGLPAVADGVSPGLAGLHACQQVPPSPHAHLSGTEAEPAHPAPPPRAPPVCQSILLCLWRRVPAAGLAACDCVDSQCWARSLGCPVLPVLSLVCVFLRNK